MSCTECEDHPVTSYVRIGKANVEIRGCEKHLQKLIELCRKGKENG